MGVVYGSQKEKYKALEEQISSAEKSLAGMNLRSYFYGMLKVSGNDPIASKKILDAIRRAEK